MKKKLIKNILFLIVFLIIFSIFSIDSYSQETIDLRFDWLSNICEKNNIQVSYFPFLLSNGIDGIVAFPIFSPSFHSSTVLSAYPYYLKYVLITYISDNGLKDEILGLRYTIEFGDFAISKKIKLNKYFTYYPGITFYMQYSSDIIYKDKYDLYKLNYPLLPHEMNLKIGTSQSMEYSINKLIFKFSTNIFLTYYDLYMQLNNPGTHELSIKYDVNGFYMVFQFFLLAGFTVRKNIKLFFGLETILSTNYIYKDIYYYYYGEDLNSLIQQGHELAPFTCPLEMYENFKSLYLVIYIAIG